MAVLGLLFWSHLPERLPRLRDQKHRVVPEARNTPPFRDDLAAALPLKKLSRTARRRQRDGARKPSHPRAWVARKPLPHHPLPPLLRPPNPALVHSHLR